MCLSIWTTNSTPSGKEGRLTCEFSHSIIHSRANTTRKANERIVDQLTSYGSAGTTIEFGYPEDLGGGDVLHHIRKEKALAGLHHILETPALVKKVIEAERDGFDAVMQTNTFDPGVEACRLAVRIPVIGVMRAALHFAACLCDRFAITVPLDSYVPYVARTVESYRMTHCVTAIRAIKLFEVGDLKNHHAAILERTVAEARQLVADGAEALLPLAASLIPYAVSPQEVEREIGVPVINTLGRGYSLCRTRGEYKDLAQPEGISLGARPQS